MWVRWVEETLVLGNIATKMALLENAFFTLATLVQDTANQKNKK